MPIHEPTLKDRLVYSNDLRRYSDFTHNFVRDLVTVTILEFPSLQAAGPLALQSLGNGNPQIEEITTSDIASMDFDADNELYGFMVELPEDMDPRELVEFRVKWLKVQAAGAGTGTALWILRYRQNPCGSGAGVALAAPATALTTPIVAQADRAQYIPQWTQWGSIAAGTLNSLVPGDDALDMSIAQDLTTITDAQLLKIQMRYRRRLL